MRVLRASVSLWVSMLAAVLYVLPVTSCSQLFSKLRAQLVMPGHCL